MSTNETIYEAYRREICSNCRNRDKDLCDIRRNTRGDIQCIYYEKDKKLIGYQRFKGRTANQGKPIMKGINK